MIRIGIVSAISAAALFAGTYNVDLDHSEVGFKVKHLAVSNVKGSFTQFDGIIEYNEKTKQLESIKGAIVVDSINTKNKNRDEHLKSADFFDSEKYDLITFESTKIDGDKVQGWLEMKGIKQMTELFISELNHLEKDPYGKERVGLSLEGKIQRIDFDLNYNKLIESGGMVVGKEITLEIDLEGVK